MVTISDDTPIGGPLRLRARPAAGTPPSLEVGHIERLLDEAARHEVKFSLDDIRFALSPMFSTEQLAISSFFCRSFYPDGPGRFRHGYDALPADADVPVIAELDALTAEYAAKKLTAMGAGRAQNLIYIPVHRLTLSSRKYRDIYLKICQGLLHHHKDSVVFDIHGIEDGTPPNRTAEYLQWLRPHAKAVAATVPIDFTTTASFTGSAIQSIGVDLAAGEADAIEPKIVRFIGRVKATGNRCHIHGANTKPLADLCLRLAADTIDGDQDADT